MWRRVKLAMRIFLTVVLALLVSLPGSVARAQSRATSAAAEQTYVIGTVGDSLGDGLWEGLYRSLFQDKRFLVLRGSRRSVGFADSDLTHQIDALAAKGRLDALVVMVGANDDGRSFFVNGRANALFGTDRWKEQYKARVAAFMAHAGRLETPLIWLLLPAMRTGEMNRAASMINALVIEAAVEHPQVALVPTYTLTSDAKGIYVTHFKDLQGRLRLMRLPDGLHFTEPGYSVLAQQALAKLVEVSPRFRAIAPANAAMQTN